MNSRHGLIGVISILLVYLVLAVVAATPGLAKTGDVWGNANGKWNVAGSPLAEGASEPITVAPGSGSMTLSGNFFTLSNEYKITCQSLSLNTSGSSIFNQSIAKGYARMGWEGCKLVKPTGCWLNEPEVAFTPLQFELKAVGSKEYALFKPRVGTTLAEIEFGGSGVCAGYRLKLQGSFGAEVEASGVESVNQPFRFSAAATVAAGGKLTNSNQKEREPALQQEALFALAG